MASGIVVTRGALRILWRRWPAHVASTALAAVAYGLLGVGWFRLVDALMHEHADRSPAPEALALALACTLLAFVIWSVCAMAQRALGVALAATDPAPSASSALRMIASRARPLLALATAFGVANAIVQVACLIAAFLAFRPATSAFAMVFLPGQLVWVAGRALTGIATANVLQSNENAFVALRSSVRVLVGHRASSLGARALVILLADAALLAVTGPIRHEGPMGGALLSLLVAVVVDLDGALEAAWHAQLRPHAFDAAAAARVFE